MEAVINVLKEKAYKVNLDACKLLIEHRYGRPKLRVHQTIESENNLRLTNLSQHNY